MGSGTIAAIFSTALQQQASETLWIACSRVDFGGFKKQYEATPPSTLFTYRGTYSKDLAKAGLVNLPENDEWIRRIASKARIVVVSWGNPGHKSGRGTAVEKILREVCDPSRVEEQEWLSGPSAVPEAGRAPARTLIEAS